jgi:TorA maturation chaperone TorD
MGSSTGDVIERYTEMGVEVSEEFSELPDHIVVEMEFMSVLCAAQSESSTSGNATESKEYYRAQKDFLTFHLSYWIPDFCELVSTNSRSPFYRLLARITHAYILKEKDRLRVHSYQIQG